MLWYLYTGALPLSINSTIFPQHLGDRLFTRQSDDCVCGSKPWCIDRKWTIWNSSPQIFQNCSGVFVPCILLENGLVPPSVLSWLVSFFWINAGTEKKSVLVLVPMINLLLVLSIASELFYLALVVVDCFYCTRQASLLESSYHVVIMCAAISSSSGCSQWKS